MPFDLTSEYVDRAAERGLCAAIAADPEAYWETPLPVDAFAAEADTYQALREAVEADQPPPAVPEDWAPARNPAATAQQLQDLYQRRALAELQQDFAQLLPDRDTPAREILAGFTERAAQIEADVSGDLAGQLGYPEDLLPGVLDAVREARTAYQEDGDHITGVRSGLGQLDEILGGFQAGLTILSGGPGTGKTTFALQVAADVSAAGVPVLFVTFENSPENLTEKGVCTAGRLNSRDVRRGRVPLEDVQAAAKRWAAKAGRLAIVEGRPDLSRGQIRAKARRLMNRFDAERCLIVVDYLQLYAKAAEDLRGLNSLREKVEVMGNELRAVGMRLRCPVIALASQHRGAGYGR
jgi:replicative DNA helicase